MKQLKNIIARNIKKWERRRRMDGKFPRSLGETFGW
jgi:hypothetical protein